LTVASRKIQVPYLGKMVWGTEVGVDETIDRASEVQLADGTRLRLKQSVISAIRLDDEFDPEGNPLYVLNAAPVMTLVHAPENLKRKRKK